MPFCANCMHASEPCSDTERFTECYNVRDEQGNRIKPHYKPKVIKKYNTQELESKPKKRKRKRLLYYRKYQIYHDYRPLRQIAEEYGITEMAVRYIKKQTCYGQRMMSGKSGHAT